MRLKSNVRLSGLVPQMVLAAIVVEGIMRGYGVECVITSANDSTHGTGSLHHRDNLCRALDFRTHFADLTGFEDSLRAAVAASLGPDFDVVLEDKDGPNEHLHVEYDPKLEA